MASATGLKVKLPPAPGVGVLVGSGVLDGVGVIVGGNVALGVGVMVGGSGVSVGSGVAVAASVPRTSGWKSVLPN